MESNEAVSALSALAHPGRLEAFRLLVKAGPEGLAAGELARRLGMPPNSLSTNLGVLAHAGLVASRREGRSVLYRAEFGAIEGLLTFLIADCCGGNPAVCGPLGQLLAGGPVSKACEPA